MGIRSKNEILESVKGTTSKYQRAMLEVQIDIRDFIIEREVARTREVKKK